MSEIEILYERLKDMKRTIRPMITLGDLTHEEVTFLIQGLNLLSQQKGNTP